MSDTRQTILDAAKPMVQARGYNALSFRDVAAAVGIKSASIHYHFPTKGDLGAALARHYTDDGMAYLAGLRAGASDIAALVEGFAAIFRAALTNDNRMCLCGIMTAEHQDLPDAVRAEVDRFTDSCVGWLAEVLAQDDNAAAAHDRALAIFAAIQGAQLVARGRGDVGLFDAIIARYREARLLP
jgi:TetR/AcrR family transcriptional repressor of nem operon